jgi:pimeloyl-ACP methyl ester carboxylesterase
MKILASLFSLCLVSAACIFFSGPQFPLRPVGSPVSLLAANSVDIVKFLQSEESIVPHLKPELAKKIIWSELKTREKTPYSLVYLHGFSASRGEISPVMENVASSIQANLFFTRFKAHGLDNGEAFATLVAQDMIDDAREALTVGRRIGQKVILVGTSTGASLALHLAFENIHQNDIAALVLISPNFGVPDWRGKYISGPAGPWLARLLLGPYHSFKPENELHASLWTSHYRSESVAAVMDLVNYVNGIDLSRLQIPVFVLYTDKDQVVRTDLILKKFLEIGSNHKQILKVEASRNHVLAGEAVSPQATAVTIEAIKSFIKNLSIQQESAEYR